MSGVEGKEDRSENTDKKKKKASESEATIANIYDLKLKNDQSLKMKVIDSQQYKGNTYIKLPRPV